MAERETGGACVCTIGHSNRAPDLFIAMLESAGVERVVDVRRFPKSRTNPDYNDDVIAAWLAPHGIGYTHMPALGGLRARPKTVPREENAFWQNRSFHNYADFALSDTFQAALDELAALCLSERCALMCAEAVWWRCHRRIIADYLLARGFVVRHIMDVGKVVAAEMTPAATPRTDGLIRYPA